MRVPVAPPARPVAITGAPSVLSTRATLTPLPPGIVVCSTVRWRRPSRKFGTASVLSIAVLSVTVRIMRPRASSRRARRRDRGAAPPRPAARVPPSTANASTIAQRRREPGLGALRDVGAGTASARHERHGGDRACRPRSTSRRAEHAGRGDRARRPRSGTSSGRRTTASRWPRARPPARVRPTTSASSAPAPVADRHADVRDAPARARPRVIVAGSGEPVAQQR